MMQFLELTLLGADWILELLWVGTECGFDERLSFPCSCGCCFEHELIECEDEVVVAFLCRVVKGTATSAAESSAVA